ncbi:RNA polymerase sigma factor [Actinoplanes sp. G11-F43]|uniref:RNA polymerase sigma factor n=1 Tax=Actinoplanes sp. G11-F43 TaxID=3424130 RepID=UPI003D32EC95
MIPAATLIPDHEIILGSRDDPERFGSIFDRHADTIHRYLARRAGRALADDLTAETFLIAFRNRTRYDRAHPDALPWLYGIAANLLRGHQRTELRQYRALARTGVDPATGCPADRVAARVTAADHVRALAAVLARLPVREREVLTLISQAQLSYPEVARALDIPVGTVRSRLHSARQQIRRALGDLPDLDLDLDLANGAEA